MIAFLRRGPDRDPIGDRAVVDETYRQLRLRVLVSVTLGYGFAYMCRLGLSVVKKPLIDEGVFTPVELGQIGAAFLWTYALGKLVNGVLADHANIRRYFAFGLFVSALVNALMGSTTLFAASVVLWALNGWFQGFLAPASVVAVTSWFSGRERGSVYGIWNASHALGEGLTFIGSATLVAATTWRMAFVAPALICAAVAAALLFALVDHPRTLGLPSVNEWKGEVTIASSSTVSARALQLEVLKLPAVWIVGLASACMYVSRYAVNNWGVLYLQEAHGYSLVEAGSLIGVNTIAGVFGSPVYGIVSDRLFGARRPPLTLVFGVVEVLALVVIFYGPSHPAVLGVGFFFYGFTISGLIGVLGGLFAVDVAPKRAAGAAMGIVGIFSYIGAGVQEWVSGVLIARGTTLVDGVRTYDFTAPVVFWVGASALSTLLAATLWRVRAREDV